MEARMLDQEFVLGIATKCLENMAVAWGRGRGAG
jgi:hypothetical protein